MPPTPPPPTAAEIEQAIAVLVAARAHGGVIDVLDDQQLRAAAQHLQLAPEELMDCVLHVGNSAAVLAVFARTR